MDSSLRIHVIGRDAWALGTEDRLARACLSTFATVVDSESEADFIHTVDVEDTAARIYRGEFVPTKPIVGAVNNHPTRLVGWPGFIRTAHQYMYLVPQSSLATADMQRLGLACPGRARIATDAESYTAIKSDEPELVRFRRRIGIPEDVYLIGLLQRDSEGRDLAVPKRQKGPDIFLALMILLQKQLSGKKIHVLLGGPRRHWIRSAFEQHAVPYTFVGKEILVDDYPENILDKKTMCLLYNLLDLYVIPTRWEGAPRQVFDVLECGRKIISTPVGIVPDILPPECIFDSLTRGAAIIRQDMEYGFLEQFIEPGRSKIENFHSIESVGREWEKVYRDVWEKEGARDTMSAGQRVRSPSAANRFLSSCCKPFAFVLEKTRLGRMKKEYFPEKLGLVVTHEEQSGLFAQLADRLSLQGVKVRLDCTDEDSVLVWNLPLDGTENLSRYDGKRIILVLDEQCCAQILQHVQVVNNWAHPLLAMAEVTIVTSDIDLARLDKGQVQLNNPVVVHFPPDPVLFRSKHAARPHRQREAQCLVFLDPDEQWNLEWLQALEQQAGVCCTVIDSLHRDWMGKTGAERAALAGENDFAVVLSSRMDRAAVSELLACGLPCLYTDTRQDIKSLAGMAGLGAENVTSFVQGVETLRDHYRSFSLAIALPSLDESAMVLADIVYAGSCGH